MSSRRQAWARASRWLGGGAAAGAVGALAGSLVEAMLRVGGAEAALTTAGYDVLALWPLTTAAVLAMRGIVNGWRPAVRAAAPAQLFAWFAVGVAALFALGGAAWLTVAWAAVFTAFRARTLAVLAPLAVVGCAAALLAASTPAARLLARGLAALDERWQRRRQRPLLTGRRLLALAALTAALSLLFLDRFLRKQLAVPALLPILAPQLAIFLAPALALAGAAAWQLVPARRRARRAFTWGPLALAAAVLAGALSRRAADPALLLDLWSQPTFASRVIERVHPLEALRGDINPAAARLVPLAGAAGTAADHPDVILITIDTVRADRTPPLLPTAAMPALAGLAAGGAAFTRAYAPGNVTRRSLPSLVTSLSPTRVRGRMSGWGLRLDPRHVLLAERFAAAGYETAGFLCCEHFWGPQRDLGWNRGLQTLRLIEDGDALAQQARNWLVERAAAQRSQKPGERRPLFLWMHFMEPHKWNGTAGLLPAPADVLPRYDATLTRVDAMLATVLEGLAADPRPRLIAVTSDHGEGLGEHATPYHSTNLYDSLLHVPLVITGPGIAPMRPAEVVGLIDVAPTLIELAGFALPPPPQLEGRSLAPLLRGQRPSDDEGGLAYAAMIPDLAVTERLEALIRGRWKIIRSGRSGPGANGGGAGVELYDLIADPAEAVNLAGSAPQFREMIQLLDARRALEAQSPFAPLAR